MPESRTIESSESSTLAERSARHRVGVARRLDAIDAKLTALLAAWHQSGVVLPADAEAKLRQAFKPEDNR